MTKFNVIDKILRWMRCRRFNKYIPKNGVVCDFGCGEDFSFLKTISDKIKKGYGIDNKYNHKNYKNIEIVNDIKDISDNSVDLVVMIAVLEHLECPVDILIKLKRILKLSGKLVLTTPTPAARPLLEFLAYKLKIINREEIMDHKCYYNKQELLYLFKKMQFKNVKHKYFQFGLNNFLEAEK